ncbi:hypothetical protein [Motilimonas pumila]|uniref:Uncharacterized protein n=1 Tax=Motilimonas pumila TaxID=2303987 RepID=A0A418YID4_9GAMM|nr:hypothetical protein [Motilimonas pumila]RJG50416.1 hypothetical protein D1Z90_02750 [Motilimonas pumila]
MPTHERSDSNISQDYQSLSKEQPSQACDNAILAASRRAVSSKPKAVNKSSWKNMPYLSAIAASLFVVVVMFAQQQQDTPDTPAIAPEAAVAPMSAILVEDSAPQLMRSTKKMSAPVSTVSGKLAQQGQQWFLITAQQSYLLENVPADIAQWSQQTVSVSGAQKMIDDQVVILVEQIQQP